MKSRATLRWRRFLLLVGVVVMAVAGALELSARRTALEFSRALAPLASLTYSSAGFSLDGSLRLSEPRLVIDVNGWRGELRASAASIRGPTGFWLFGQLLVPRAGIPDQLGIRTTALRLGDDGVGAVVSEWTGVSSLVPFENLGCGSDALTDKDRRRMGVDPGERSDQFNYRLDRANGRLSLTLKLRDPGIAEVRGFAELSGFDASRWQELFAQSAVRLVRAGFSYDDPGYLARRNQFCAQWLGTNATDFIARHVAVVNAFLGARGVQPSKELSDLYEKLVTRGGVFSLTSLPEATWAPSELAAYPRQKLLRLLNVTTRLGDAPPIMFRLSFSDPDKPFEFAPETELVDRVQAGVSETDEFEESVEDNGSVAGNEPVNTAVAKVPPTIAKEPSVEVAQVEPPESAAPDETEASLPQPLPVLEDTLRYAVSDPRDSGGRIIPSAPPPPEDSTLALVWKPGVIERLAPQEVKEKSYRVVATGAISTLVGQDVRVLTSNGKRVAGKLMRVTTEHAVLKVKVGGGEAELQVLLSRIREVRVPLRHD